MRLLRILGFTVIVLVSFSVFTSYIFGQVTINPAGPLTYNLFLVSDLGLEGGGKANRDISMTFTAGPSSPQAITLEVKDLNSNQVLVSGQTDSQSYSQIQGTHLVSQIQREFGGDFEIKDQAKALKDKVLATGALPRGHYRITIGLDNDPSSDSIDVFIVPPYLQPNFPIDIAVSRSSLKFDWITNIGRQEFHIFEDRAGRKEVLKGSRLPGLNRGIASDKPKKSTVDGAEIAPLLEDGKVYYWQVWGYINTSHGDELVKGILTQFQYFEYLRGIEYIGLTDEDKKDIKDALIVLLQKLVDKKAANSIENYDVNRVVIDNSPVTREEIMTVLQAIIDDKLTATSIRLQ